jgi:hypothetical protein
MAPQGNEKLDEVVRLMALEQRQAHEEIIRLLKEILAAIQPKPATQIKALFGKPEGET